jgi:hypothetical protein
VKIRATIQGITPLLMNRFSDEAEITTTSGHTPALRGNGKGTPREQAERTSYRDASTGDLYLPGPNVFAALVEAGKFHKLGKNKVTTQKSSLVPAGLLVEEIMVPLGTRDFEVDSRRVRIPATGGCVMRHRARLDRWTATFTIDVDESVFSPEFVRALLDDAGKKVGIGDYRPATRGPFGRFVVIRWEVADA